MCFKLYNVQSYIMKYGILVLGDMFQLCNTTQWKKQNPYNISCSNNI